MKVLRLTGPGELVMQEEPRPAAGPGESLVRVTAVGICGSDLHWYTDAGIGDNRLQRPLVLGHEFAGVIEGGPQNGQRVAVDPAVNCNNCEQCHDGNPNLCLNLRFAGDGPDDGAMRQYMNWPNQSIHPIPDAFSDADGAMLEPLGVAIHAVDLAHIRPAMSVGVFGCGPIGLLLIQVVRAAGATTIVATDKLPHRLKAATDLGATAAFLADGRRESADILSATGGRGVDVAFEAAGENEAIDTAVASTRRGAIIILAGIPAEERSSFNASAARRKGLTFKLVRRMQHMYPRAISLVESGVVDVRSIVSHSFKMEEYERAFALAEARQGLKVVVEP